MDKLTTLEIEEKINQYRQRVETLSNIINDIKDAKAKAELQTHIESYQTTIADLRAELSRRNSKRLR